MWWISSIIDAADVSSSAIRSSKDDDVVGFEEDLKMIKNRLLWGPSTLQVLAVVGRGGIGKTTLAKTVYEDASVMKYFNLCSWITISQDHSVERIVLNLLASMKGISAVRDAESDIPMESLIHKHLERSRYLIVMDDMWSKKAWDDVKMLFPDTRNGSRIIVTTRMQDVVDYVSSSSSIHPMRLLDAHHSWNLLKQKVFADKDFPVELEDIGKKIVQNCGGLPLSIVVVAGLLSKVRTRSSWEQIAANDGQLETIICLSYTHLPNHSKPCLLYMAGFPEDQEIRVTELVNLWISEGFVTHSNGSKSLEEEAEDCLEDLVERSLVLDTNRKFDGKIKSCRLHDTVREFLVREATKEKIILSVMDYLPTPILRKHFVPRLIKDHHRISASSYDLHLKDYVHSSYIRTIICIPKKGYRSMGVVEKFSSLRVLHVLRRSDYWDWEPDCGSTEPTAILAKKLRKVAQRLQSTVGDVVDYIKGKGVTDSPAVGSSSRSAITSSEDGFWWNHPDYGFSQLLEGEALCGWVTISQDYNIGTIALHLLASIKGMSADRKIPIDSLIREYLHNNKYLIIVDDICSKKAWDEVKMLFPENDNGSRIIYSNNKATRCGCLCSLF
ncbi:putative late blight resistance protein homolog R1B-16 [Salvia miltiorrhiza]|uniref:putative late blight resistance protein homolog R1B-16 n=1 Tax=Salvia miltiorrhiza TaxID=226208 RepID=UPI0025AD7A56|nr:putative late blight resistance protein homolog R1B-16 [Salvia miltiorrhiza]